MYSISWFGFNFLDWIQIKMLDEFHLVKSSEIAEKNGNFV